VTRRAGNFCWPARIRRHECQVMQFVTVTCRLVIIAAAALPVASMSLSASRQQVRHISRPLMVLYWGYLRLLSPLLVDVAAGWRGDGVTLAVNTHCQSTGALMLRYVRKPITMNHVTAAWYHAQSTSFACGPPYGRLQMQIAHAPIELSKYRDSFAGETADPVGVVRNRKEFPDVIRRSWGTCRCLAKIAPEHPQWSMCRSRADHRRCHRARFGRPLRPSGELPGSSLAILHRRGEEGEPGLKPVGRQGSVFDLAASCVQGGRR